MKAPRRPRGAWTAYNDWWRSFTEYNKKAPGAADVQEWYDKNSATIWPGKERPSLDATVTHSKGLRTNSETRTIPKVPREAKRARHEGAQDADMDQDARPTNDQGNAGLSATRAAADVERRRMEKKPRRAAQPNVADNDQVSKEGHLPPATTCQAGDAPGPDIRGTDDNKGTSDGASRRPHDEAAAAAATAATATTATEPAPKLAAQAPTAAGDQGPDGRPRAPRQQPQRAARTVALAALTSTPAAGKGGTTTASSGKSPTQIASADGRPTGAAAQAPAGSAASRSAAAGALCAPAAMRPLINAVGDSAGEALPPAATCQRAAPQSPPPLLAFPSKAARGSSPFGPQEMNTSSGGKQDINKTVGSSPSGARGSENVPLLRYRELSVGSGAQRSGDGGSGQPQPVWGVLGLRAPVQQQHLADSASRRQQDCKIQAFHPHRPPLYPRLAQQKPGDASAPSLQNVAAHAAAKANASVASYPSSAGLEAVHVLTLAQTPRALATASSGLQLGMQQSFSDILSGALPMELLWSQDQVLPQQGCCSQGSAPNPGTESSGWAGCTPISESEASRQSMGWGSAGSCGSGHGDAIGGSCGGSVRRSSVGTTATSGGGRPTPPWGLISTSGFDPTMQRQGPYGGYDPYDAYLPYGAGHLYGVHGTEWYGISSPGYPPFNGMPAPERPLGPWGLPPPYYYGLPPPLPAAAPAVPPSSVKESLIAPLPPQQARLPLRQSPAQGQLGTYGCRFTAAAERPTRPSAALPGVRIPALAPAAAAAAPAARAGPQAPKPVQPAAPSRALAFHNNRSAFCRLPHRDYEALQEEELDALYQSQMSSQDPLALSPGSLPDADMLDWELLTDDAPNAPAPGDMSSLAWAGRRAAEAAEATTWPPGDWGSDARGAVTSAAEGVCWADVAERLGDEAPEDMAGEFDRFLMSGWAAPVPPQPLGHAVR